MRLAISAEFAGLFATQKPGKESKIPTFTSPPYRGFGRVVVVEELVEVGTVVAGARVVLSGSVVELVGRVVATSDDEVVVVSFVVESVHAAASNDDATSSATTEDFLKLRIRMVIIRVFPFLFLVGEPYKGNCCCLSELKYLHVGKISLGEKRTYGGAMELKHGQDIAGHNLVVAVMHDEARIWRLDEIGSEPSVFIKRTVPESIHVRQAQSHHMHSHEIGETEYFMEISEALSGGLKIIVVGHGTGKANASERFMKYLEQRHSALLPRIVSSENANLPHMSNAEIIAGVRHRWLGPGLRPL